MRALFAALLIALPARAWCGSFCAALPEASAQEKAFVAKAAPELQGAAVKTMPAEAALSLLGQAAAQGASSLDLFTSDMAREGCAVLINEKVLAAVEKAYDLGLYTDLSGRDVDGVPFKTVGFVFGRGRLVTVHDRDGFSYYHPKYQETLTYERIVRSQTPEPGLMNVKGIKGPMGVSVSRFRKIAGGMVEVKAGPMTVKRPLAPIAAR